MKRNTHSLEPNRLVEIDYLKAISIVGVIFIHMSFESRFTPSMLDWISFMQKSLGWCVLSFFFCSGVLSEKSLKLSLNAARIFVKKKIVGLLVPYFSFNILYKLLLCVISLSGFVQWTAPLPDSLISTLIFFVFPVEPQLYFLTYLFIVSCIYYILLLLLRKHYFVHLIVLFLFGVFYMFASPLLKVHGKELILFPLYLLSYSSGALMSFHLSDKSRKNLYFPMLFLVIALGCWKTSLLYIFVAIPPILFLMLRKAQSIIDGPKDQGRKISEWIAFVGKKSGAIYIWHAPVLMSFLSILLTKIVGHNYLTIVALVFLSIIIPCFLDFLVSQFKFLRFLRV